MSGKTHKSSASSVSSTGSVTSATSYSSSRASSKPSSKPSSRRSTSASTSTSSPMDEKFSNSSSSFMSFDESQNECTGKLIATILSSYDLPNDLRPTTVQMEVHFQDDDDDDDDYYNGSKGINHDDKEDVIIVETGPPVARHKDKNSFKFISNGKKSEQQQQQKQPHNNELIVNAPLSHLYPATIIFRVKLEGSHQDLIATVNLASTLQINHTQWLILNLAPEPKPDQEHGEATIDTEDSAAFSSSSPPTLRLKLHLAGAYRPQISTLCTISQTYFNIIDKSYSSLTNSVQTLTDVIPKSFPAAKLLLVPSVPILTTWVAGLPILLGILILALPFFLPLVLLLLTILVSCSGFLLVLYASTSSGRSVCMEWLGPLFSTFVTTPSGQRLIYNTGPPPTPVQLIQTIMPTEMIPKLCLCLTIDFIGSSSYLIPFAGEATDIVWAPIQSLLIAAMFDDTTPALKYLSFAEELLPFTDVIPTATLGWIKEFGPSLLLSGKDKAEEMSVVLRREKAAFKEGVSD